MSYEQKYLKYKSKYLTLKNQFSLKNSLKDNMIGGSKKVSKQITDLNELTSTPSMMEVYGYEFNLKGGNHIKENRSSDIKKLSKLLEDSESVFSNLSSEQMKGDLNY